MNRQVHLCGLCGKPVVWLRDYWAHADGSRPRHPANPKQEPTEMAPQEANLSVAQSPDQREAVAKFVRELCAGFIGCGPGTKLKVRPPFKFSVELTPSGIRITPDERVAVERDGVDPWLEYIDAHMDGKVVAGLRLIVAFEKEV